MYDQLWQKRVWIPFWVIQIIFVCILLAIMAYALSLFVDGSNGDYSLSYGYSSYYSDYSEDVFRAASAVAGVYIAIFSITILFNIVEIMLFARKRLSPVTAVVLESIATLVWTVIFILTIVGAVRAGTGAYGFIFIIIVLAMALGKLIYSSVILHRYRKGRFATRGAYSTPAQAEAGFEPSPSGAYIAYAPASVPAPNPFRDPSRDQSPMTHHAGGAAASYYDTAARNNNGAYEMRQTGGRP